MYSRYWTNDIGDFDEIEYMTRLSSHLPDWIFFYAAPNQLRFNPTEKLEVPLVINQGKQLFFVKAKKQT